MSRRRKKIRVSESEKDAIRAAASAMGMEDAPHGAIIREACKRATEQKTIKLTADEELLEALQ